MVEIGKFVWVDLSCVIIKHLTFCIIQSFIGFLCILIYLAVTDALKAARFFKSRTESAYSCKDIKIFYQYESSSFRFFQQKTVKLFSKLDRHIDIFISSYSVCSLSSLTIWKSSTPGITPNVLPLLKTQCTVPISSICSIFLLCRVRLPFFFVKTGEKHLRFYTWNFYPQNAKKARKYELFEVCIYFIAQVWLPLLDSNQRPFG